MMINKTNPWLKAAIKAAALGRVKLLNVLLTSRLVNTKSRLHLDCKWNFLFDPIDICRDVHDPCSCNSGRGLHANSRKEIVQCFHPGTLLEVAARHGQVGSVELLLSHGADPHVEYGGITALFQTIKYWSLCYKTKKYKYWKQYYDTVKILLRNTNVGKYCENWFANPSSVKSEFYIVNFSCLLHFPAALEMLLDAGFPLIQTTGPLMNQTMYWMVQNDVSFQVAHQDCQIDCLKLLAEHGCTVQKQFYYSFINDILMWYTIETLNVYLLEKLLDLGFNIPNYCLRQKFWVRPIQEMAISLSGQNALNFAKTIISIKGIENMTEIFTNLSPLFLPWEVRWTPRIILYLLRAGAKVQKTSESLENIVNRNWPFKIGISSMSDPEKDELYFYMMNTKSIQRTLIFQCKICIRRSLKLCTKSRVRRLKLPAILSQFILLEN